MCGVLTTGLGIFGHSWSVLWRVAIFGVVGGGWRTEGVGKEQGKKKTSDIVGNLVFQSRFLTRM